MGRVRGKKCNYGQPATLSSEQSFTYLATMVRWRLHKVTFRKAIFVLRIFLNCQGQANLRDIKNKNLSLQKFH